MLESQSATPPPTEKPPGDPVLALRLLRDYLQHCVDDGQARIWLSRDARKTLRAMMVSRSAAKQRPAPAAAPKPAASVQAARMENRPDQPAANMEPAPRPAWPMLSRDEREKALEAVKKEAANSQKVRDLGTLRETMVFAVGNPEAQIMFIGEAPGYDEEKQREPFVGKAGQLLTKIIKAMGLERETVYISNVCKYRPRMENQLTDNRKPTAEEMNSCLPFIQREIEIIQPKAIVALGATAAEGLLGLVGAAVGRLRGKFHAYQGIPVMVTYHPSYLLRNESLSERRKVWEDMLMVMEKIGLPISEKQRRFFTRDG